MRSQESFDNNPQEPARSWLCPAHTERPSALRRRRRTPKVPCGIGGCFLRSAPPVGHWAYSQRKPRKSFFEFAEDGSTTDRGCRESRPASFMLYSHTSCYGTPPTRFVGRTNCRACTKIAPHTFIPLPTPHDRPQRWILYTSKCSGHCNRESTPVDGALLRVPNQTRLHPRT